MIKLVLFIFMAAALAWAQDAKVEDFKSNIREFTGAVYNELLTGNNYNILVSPLSVETVLALVQSGAIGDTGSEIRKTLRLPNSQAETENIIKTVLPTIQSDHYILQVANKIYVGNDYLIKQNFQNLARDVYNASFQNIEFKNSEKAADEINHWVENETGDKIHDLVSSDDFDENTSIVLINALYFQGNWSAPFISSQTAQSQFFMIDGDTIEVDTMHQKSVLVNYYESKELDAIFLEIPFSGQNASMTFLIPNKIGGIGLLEKQIDTVLVTPTYSSEFIELFLPKFKIESTIDFVDVLQKMGIIKAFNPTEADFSGIAGKKGELSIGNVVQKTFIEVNEVGVAAAAATVVDITRGSATATKTVVIDRPFFFYIRVNGIILFEGRVLVP